MLSHTFRLLNQTNILRVFRSNLFQQLNICLIENESDGRNLLEKIFAELRFFSHRCLNHHFDKILSGGQRNQMRSDTVPSHPGTNLYNPYIAVRINPKLRMRCTILNSQCIQSPMDFTDTFFFHSFRKRCRLHMPCFNIMRISCGKLLCNCQTMMLSLTADGFHTIFFSLNIAFYNCFFLK